MKTSGHKVGDLVRVNDTVHADHEPHEVTRHHAACRYVGAVLNIGSAIEEDGVVIYQLEGVDDAEFFDGELEAVEPRVTDTVVTL